MLKILRCSIRCLGLIVIAVGLPFDWLISVYFSGRRNLPGTKARLLNRWSGFVIRLTGCRVNVLGRPPTHGLCVSNHLSYLDISVLGSTGPMTFVSKHDVLSWPLFGQWAALCGTLFIKRERKGHVASVGDQMAEVLKARVPLVLFPEGTSSSGEAVLPFKSSLFEPAVEHQWPVTPMHISYEVEVGSASEEVAYWGDMTLLPHLLNLFTKRKIRATVAFGDPIEPGTNRKDLCRRAYEAVSNLAVATISVDGSPAERINEDARHHHSPTPGRDREH